MAYNNEENVSEKQKADHLWTWLTLGRSLDVLPHSGYCLTRQLRHVDVQRVSGVKDFGKIFLSGIMCCSAHRHYSTPRLPNRH